MDHGSSFRGGTDFGVHSGTVATENMVIGAQAEQQAAFKDTSYGTGGQHYTISNTAHDDNSGIRSDNHSESSNKDHYSAGEPDFTDTSDRYSSMRDHFTQAESRHRPTQIIVLPPPLYPDRVTIKDRHEQAENLTTVPSTLPKKENTRYRPLSSGTLENSDNASDKLVGPVQTWKAHPEVLVIRTNPVKRPTLPPLQSIHSYQPSSFSSSLNLDYY
ncbi:hypothetical protein BIW11_14163 [Tropilaelaps mercedesae]|uniref:Uncharacterized protein n=1 Tax=Tropilaelaps mercedesae TaxID=418985 RepID=A0A1V9WYY8_9ACAR|nr:hypothetical protein BIW11_14163 [Tropilaelaps mercedesae]